MADPESLVTVATFSQIEEAEIAHALLEAAEIPSFLTGEATAQTMWHLTQAIGGVGLQVAAEDEARARAVLAERGEIDASDEELRPEAPAESPASAAREKSADRAYRGAIVGLVLAPVVLHLFSAWSLVDFWTSAAPVDARARRRAWTALMIDASVFVAAAVLARVLLRER